MRLYEVGVEGQELQALLEESGGELTPELEQRFDEFLKGGKEKINAACCVRRNLEAGAEACKAEAKRLAERAASLEKAKDSLSGRILAAVDFGFDGKVKTALFTVWGQNSPDRKEYTPAADTDLLALAAVFPGFVRVNAELNKSGLNDAVKLGMELPKAIQVEDVPGKRSLRVK